MPAIYVLIPITDNTVIQEQGKDRDLSKDTTWNLSLVWRQYFEFSTVKHKPIKMYIVQSISFHFIHMDITKVISNSFTIATVTWNGFSSSLYLWLI